MRAIVPAIVMAFLGLVSIPAEGNRILGDPDFFTPETVLDLELRFDLDSLKADIAEDPSYHPAVLAYSDPRDHSPVEIRIQVRARGSFRRNPENCDFPPLKLRFGKKDRQGSLFEDIKELKVVTHCQSSRNEFEQYLLQEYLIYKAYNLFTEFSFRVRLARITYVDLSGGTVPFTRLAFLLEDAGDMADRNHARPMKFETLSVKRLNQELFALMSMFNYMMQNTDYSVPMLHNIELLSTDPFQPPIPVPYDFDWSGMINIPYQSPYASARSRYADRMYKGPCLKRKNLERVLDILRERRDELYALYRDCIYLNEDFKRRSLQELDLFYISIGNRQFVRKEFIRKCRD